MRFLNVSCESLRNVRDILRGAIFLAPNLGLKSFSLKLDSWFLLATTIANSFAEYSNPLNKKWNYDKFIKIFEPYLEGICNILLMSWLNSNENLNFDTDADFKKIIIYFAMCLCVQAQLHHKNDMLITSNPHFMFPMAVLYCDPISIVSNIPLQSVSRLTIGIFSLARGTKNLIHFERPRPTARL